MPQRQPRPQRRLPPTLAALVLLATLTGCAGGLEFAAIGAAANATQAGAAVIKGGKIDSAVFAPRAELVAAVEAALNDLELEVTQRGVARQHRLQITAQDEHREKVKIRIREQTPALNRLQVDVGWFGHDPTARLVALRIQYHLRQNGHVTDAFD